MFIKSLFSSDSIYRSIVNKDGCNVKVNIKSSTGSNIIAIFDNNILVVYDPIKDTFSKAHNFEDFFDIGALVEISFHMYKFYKSLKK